MDWSCGQIFWSYVVHVDAVHGLLHTSNAATIEAPSTISTNTLTAATLAATKAVIENEGGKCTPYKMEVCFLLFLRHHMTLARR